MSQNSRPENGGNRLVGVAHSLPPAAVDCSHWEADIPPEQWCTGELIGVARSLPGTVADCSAWAEQPALAVSVRFEDGELSDSFVRAIHQTAPNARLERTPTATVILALPNHDAVAALYGAFQQLQAAGCVIGSEGGAFHIRRKAS